MSAFSNLSKILLAIITHFKEQVNERFLPKVSFYVLHKDRGHLLCFMMYLGLSAMKET